MEDKFSSPSSSSHGGSSSTPDRKMSGGDIDSPSLVVSGQPPQHVFSEQFFPLELGLELPQGPQQATVADFKVRLRLKAARKGSSAENAELRVQETDPIILGPHRRSRTVHCQIHQRQPIPRDKGATYAITVETESRQGIVPTITRAINMINYKIKIGVGVDWSDVWYKDEGGRDKCMEVAAQIRDSDNILQKFQVPLQLILCYAKDNDRVVVRNQEILRTVGTHDRIHIDKSTGTARIRFRVEDVSKNHQGQGFSLEVAPERSKGFRDIGPGYTPAVAVRSKRNKRSRASQGRAAGERHRPSPGMARSMASETFEGANIEQLRRAMKGVIGWTEEVVSGLYPLQWHVVGYSQHPDGSPDYSRPYHSMPNPNVCISRILSMYSDRARNDLRVLLTSIEHAVQVRGPRYGQHASPDEIFRMTGQGVPQPPPPIPPHMLASGMGVPSPQSLMPGQGPPPYAGGEPPPPGMGPPPFNPNLPPSDYYAEHEQGFARIPPREESSMEIPSSTEAAHPGDKRRADYKVSDQSSRESEVEYVLAKQYKSMRSGGRLGFPAYSASKEILGFYRENDTKVGVGQFVPIENHADDFGPPEIRQATEILEKAIENKNEAVHALKDWGTISNLMDHALVYDWSKNIGSDAPHSSDSSPDMDSKPTSTRASF